MSRRRFACAVAVTAVVLAVGSIAPAFGASESLSPARAYKLALRALSLSKKSDGQSMQALRNSTRALNFSKRPGSTGPQGARGSEGLDGPAGPGGDRGPRGATGPQGVPGVDGTAGATGADGAPGPTGPQGVPGTARAYATVLPSGSIVDDRSHNLTAARPSDDLFCLTPAAGISAASASAVVSVDLDLSSGALGTVFAEVDSSGATCDAGELAVRTKGPTANAVGFTIVIP
jgi:collagen triple helix repeat protein